VGRALRIGLWVALALGLILVGVGVGVFMRMNEGWVTLRWPLPQATPSVVGSLEYESPVWVVALGWVITAILVTSIALWFPIYLTQRRRVQTENRHLRRENADLRNLPIHSPAPLEDLPTPEPVGIVVRRDEQGVRGADHAAVAPGHAPDSLIPSEE
jgi:hypothetical protein